jgi:hypothetical protein
MEEVLQRELKWEALVAGTTEGENGFTFGVLYAREQQAAEEARRHVKKLLG